MRKIKVTPTERRILDAVKAAKAQGIEIVQGAWSVRWDAEEKKFVCENNCCCPLGALLLTEQPEVVGEEEDIDDAEQLSQVAAAVLGKDEEWTNNFVEAYDDDDTSVVNSAYKAGAKVRDLLNF